MQRPEIVRMSVGCRKDFSAVCCALWRHGEIFQNRDANFEIYQSELLEIRGLGRFRWAQRLS